MSEGFEGWVRPSTTRDMRPPTARDVRPPTARDGGLHQTQPDRSGDVPLPDYLECDYVVESELNSGGEADVAVIRHRLDGHRKVVKVYRRGITLPQSFVDSLAHADPAHVLPVVRSTYTGWRSPRFIEVMDYLPNGSLETLLQRAGGSLPDLARDIVVEMSDALDYIHNRMGIVHRDIKPANVLLRQRDPLDLVLADLGIATELAEIRRSRRETTGGVKGTLVYQSPETLNMSDAGASRDWWALGMMLCEVLTGQHPFKDSSGNTLRDENRIRHAITMGAIDLSMIHDERWNLLCRGLLLHDPQQRWDQSQIRAWLAGESPRVAFAEPARASGQHLVRPYRFAGSRFTDPVALASHMVQNWDAAAAVFTSAEECTTLRAWICDDVKDSTIEVNALTAIGGGDQSQVDARIIEFTTHFRGGADVVFRGVPITAQALAVRYLQSGDGWHQDPLLSALKPRVMAALAGTQLDEDAGPNGQCEEYYALARLSRMAEQVDAVIAAAVAGITRAASDRVDGADVGSAVRDGLPIRATRARALARAALLSPRCLQDIRTEFNKLDARHSGWFAALCAKAVDDGQRMSAGVTDVDVSEIGVKVLSTAVFDLAVHYEQARAHAEAAAECRRREAEASAARQRQEREAAATEAARQEDRADRVFHTLLSVGAGIACVIAMLIGGWLVHHVTASDGWPSTWAYALLHWRSPEFQHNALIMGFIASIVIAIVINTAVQQRRNIPVFCLIGYSVLCMLPIVGALLCYALLVALGVLVFVVVLFVGVGALSG